jgi:hypothetical protein
MNVGFDKPTSCVVATRAIPAKIARVNIIYFVTGDAVEQALLRREPRRDVRACIPHPPHQPRASFSRFIPEAAKLSEADSSKSGVIHRDGARDTGNVLIVARRAVSNRGVERAGLPLKHCGIIGVTRDTLCTGHSADRRVAGRAIVPKKRMRTG